MITAVLGFEILSNPILPEQLGILTPPGALL